MASIDDYIWSTILVIIDDFYDKLIFVSSISDYKNTHIDYTALLYIFFISINLFWIAVRKSAMKD